MHAVLSAARAAAGLLLLAGCSVAPAPPGSGLAPQPAPPPNSSSDSAKVNLEEIFPPGRGRELVLNNCTTCHTFVPIVVLQMSEDAWRRNSRDHRERVKALSDADFRTLYAYLAANFNPSKPVPKLPQALLETWTAY